MFKNLDISYDSVVIDNLKLKKPDYLSVSEWTETWESINKGSYQDGYDAATEEHVDLIYSEDAMNSACEEAEEEGYEKGSVEIIKEVIEIVEKLKDDLDECGIHDETITWLVRRFEAAF